MRDSFWNLAGRSDLPLKGWRMGGGKASSSKLAISSPKRCSGAVRKICCAIFIFAVEDEKENLIADLVIRSSRSNLDHGTDDSITERLGELCHRTRIDLIDVWRC